MIFFNKVLYAHDSKFKNYKENEVKINSFPLQSLATQFPTLQAPLEPDNRMSFRGDFW